MKKEEKERLQEDDAFIKFVNRTWEKIVGRRRMFLALVAVLVIGLVAYVVAYTIVDRASDKALTQIDTAETLKEQEAALAQQPNSPDLLLKLGSAYARRGTKDDVQTAEGLLARALKHAKTDLQNGVISLALGKVKMDLGQSKAALELLEAALDNRHAAALYRSEANWHAGRCLEFLGRTDEAADRYRDIYAARESAGDIWVLLAQYRATKLRQAALE